MAGSLDFSVSSFFTESDTPVHSTGPAAPSAVPTYFAGLIYIFWMSLAGFRLRVRELCTGVFFFFRRRRPSAGPPLPHPTPLRTSLGYHFTFISFVWQGLVSGFGSYSLDCAFFRFDSAGLQNRVRRGNNHFRLLHMFVLHLLVVFGFGSRLGS